MDTQTGSRRRRPAAARLRPVGRPPEPRPLAGTHSGTPRPRDPPATDRRPNRTQPTGPDRRRLRPPRLAGPTRHPGRPTPQRLPSLRRTTRRPRPTVRRATTRPRTRPGHGPLAGRTHRTLVVP